MYRGMDVWMNGGMETATTDFSFCFAKFEMTIFLKISFEARLGAAYEYRNF